MLCSRFLVQALAWRLASCSQFIGVHLLWTHTGHVLAAAPYLILFACLLMHSSATVTDISIMRKQVNEARGVIEVCLAADRNHLAAPRRTKRICRPGEHPQPRQMARLGHAPKRQAIPAAF